MLLKLTTLVYDKYNPEKAFQAGTCLKVNNVERAKDLIARSLAKEATKPNGLIYELDPKGGDPTSPKGLGKALEEMTVAELLKLAKKRGITINKKSKKGEIIDLLK